MDSQIQPGSTVAHSPKSFKYRIRKLWANLARTLKADKKDSLLSPVETLEDRVLLSAILPVFVDGEFSFGNPNSDAPYGAENTFKLESNPTASKTIFLDFDGHHSVNNRWGHDIVFDRFDRDGDVSSFSIAELIEIQKQFQNVAEDFFPFNVNVTTIDPGLDALLNTGGNDNEWGIRSLATQAKNGFGNGIGGVAYIGFFGSPGWDFDAPAFTFNKGVNNGGMTHSHEIGHTLGLSHDGLNELAYHPGVGAGDTSWGPIMGAPFGKNIVHWSQGEYPGSTTVEDDLNLITTRSENGFGYRADDHGNGINVATELSIQSATEVSGWGIIGRSTDVDFFRFTTGEGNVQITLNPFQENPNLDIEAKLYDSSGTLLATSNPVDGVNASFDVNVLGGDYFVSVDGVGKAGVYTDYGSLGFFSIVGDIQEPVDPPPFMIGETGHIDINHNWTTVELNGFYIDPVIVASTNTANDADPLTLRIRNVTNNTFEIQIDEWDYQERFHGVESVSYMVMESGIHILDSGMKVFAGNTSVNHKWINIQFNELLDNAPVVLSQTTTRNGGAAVVTRMDDITSEGFKLKLQEEQAADGTHSFETVAWIAFDMGVGSIGTTEFDSDVVAGVRHVNSNFDFNTSFDDTPALFAAMQTFNGSDTANVRISDSSPTDATVNIQEERSKDNEIRHVAETVGYVALDLGDIIGESRIGEAGRASGVTNQWQVVDLIQTYVNPVVVAGMISLNDDSPANVRIRNVTSGSFEIHIDEWDYLDRMHGPETVGYFVVEAGIHKLADGTIITANNSTANHNWKGIDFGYNFDDAPVVFSQTTSFNGKSAVTTRMNGIDSDGFQVKLQEEEFADGTHSVESLSWIAIDEGISGSDEFGFQSFLRDGLNHDEQFINFSRVFAQTPIVLGNIQTYRDADTATMRLTEDGIARFGVDAFLEEERSFDAEIMHATEEVGILALDQGRMPGTTIDFFSGPLTGSSPQAFTLANRIVFVPRVTYVDNGPVITETALPFAHSEDVQRFYQTSFTVNDVSEVRGLSEVAFASNNALEFDFSNNVNVDTPLVNLNRVEIATVQSFENVISDNIQSFEDLSEYVDDDSNSSDDIEDAIREIKIRMESVLT